jgi:hypothetical protein
VLTSISNAPLGSAVSNMYAAVRAQSSASAWSALIKPINDTLRMRRRDALVAFALVGLSNDTTRASIDTPDRLYEYLLLDVLIHPRVETSRIRQAIAAVQQFIQRLVDLPNSEPKDIEVPLAMREQWPWMKRYRVWEANRKVFLYPENWLEPELRDDQSPIFRETMSELLQGDITEERAAEAMVGYVRKLEEISMLEPCGIHVDTRETAGDATDDVMHVIARSSGANRNYHYRRREPSGWTPWEPVKLDVEDNPVLPVRWKGRLYLFWLKVIQEAGEATTPSWSSGRLDSAVVGKPADPTHRVKAMLCWSEFARGRWGPTRTSSTERAVTLGTAFTAPTGSNPFRREQYRLRVALRPDALDVWIETLPGTGLPSTFLDHGYRLYNSFADPDVLDRTTLYDYFFWRLGITPNRNVWVEDPRTSSALRVAYLPNGGTRFSAPNEHALFRRIDGFSGSAVAPAYDVTATWNRTAPFFYKDAKYAFYISPVSVAPVGFVPWKSYQSGKSIFQIADRSIKPVENSRYQAETQRFSLNIRSRFAVGAYETDETGSIVKI